ncbi:Hypothetical protein FKW44_017159 [Caligus rogercresseyi]|uniref:Uncharacterized protein n=1 Tax=Caligus rogercresseyi TaxID=217165 RepID=A0A7T8K2M6_CALRO|nr:Hypothetical protein FKW44_017159 [Caligus rogercresseyi]
MQIAVSLQVGTPRSCGLMGLPDGKTYQSVPWHRRPRRWSKNISKSPWPPPWRPPR